jgi:leucyl/phenylalanyl-tRNA--protein transferase
VALVSLVQWLRDTAATLLDVQWMTPHLRTLGAVDLRRHDYLERLDLAIHVGAPRSITSTLPSMDRGLA